MSSGLDPDSVGSNLDPNCLHFRLSADDKSCHSAGKSQSFFISPKTKSLNPRSITLSEYIKVDALACN